MFKFGKSETVESTEPIEDTISKGETLIIERQNKLEEFKKRIEAIRQKWVEHHARKEELLLKKKELEEKINDSVLDVASKLVEGSTDSVELKSELIKTDEEIEELLNFEKEAEDIYYLKDDLRILSESIRSDEFGFSSDLKNLKDLEREIEYLESGAKGHFDRAHKETEEDIEILTAIKAKQLEEEDKAKKIVDLYENYDEEQKKIFLAGLKEEDRFLFDEFISGELTKDHKIFLDRVSDSLEKDFHKSSTEEYLEEMENNRKEKFEIIKAKKEGRFFDGYIADKHIFSEGVPGHLIGINTPLKRKYGSSIFDKIKIVGFFRKSYKDDGITHTDKFVIIEETNFKDNLFGKKYLPILVGDLDKSYEVI